MVFQIVSENSEADVARRRAVDEMAWPLKELAANLIRTVRGAGTPGLLASQMVAVLKKLESYHDAVGSYPSGGEISEALSIRFRHQEAGIPRDDFEAAIATIVQGALQVAASELLGQHTQISAGETEMLDGVRRLEQHWETVRREAAKTIKPRRSATKRRT